MLAAFIGITLKAVVEESETSYYYNDRKEASQHYSKASVSMGNGLIGMSLDIGPFFFLTSLLEYNCFTMVC